MIGEGWWGLVTKGREALTYTIKTTQMVSYQEQPLDGARVIRITCKRSDGHQYVISPPCGLSKLLHLAILNGRI